jgi:hypothetical protein
MTDTYTVADVVVTGQRRTAGSAAPFPTIESVEVRPKLDDEIGADEGMTLCDNPDLRRDWNADAAAAKLTSDLKNFANSNPPNGDRGFSAREYGAVLWELPDGSVVHGPMTYGDQSFPEASQSENGRAGVVLDWTPPMAGAVPIGTLHTHPPGGHVPSGSPNNPRLDDIGVLTSTSEWRSYYSQKDNGKEAKLYLAADNLVSAGQTQTTKINVYDYRNIGPAIAGQHTGPEVNPDGDPCGQ